MDWKPLSSAIFIAVRIKLRINCSMAFLQISEKPSTISFGVYISLLPEAIGDNQQRLEFAFVVAESTEHRR